MPGAAPQPTALRWADLGCGDGLFTEALARFLPAGSTVYGIDLRPSLYSESVNGVSLVPIQNDFINMPFPLDELDGILMANSFHYVEDKSAFLHRLRPHLRPGAPLLFVEYDTDRPVPTWVPFPVSYASLRPLLEKAGWPRVQKLGQMPSVYGSGNIYSAFASVPKK
jgi:trans-aconitate methyltransferase